MKYVKLNFNPGINRDWTSYSNTGGWYDCNLIRFRNGKPETIGGWEKVTSDTFMGVCRSMFSWTSLDGSNLTAVGTNLKLYVEEGGIFSDITPNRVEDVALGVDPFTTVNTSTTVTVSHTAHGALEGDFVAFSGSSAVNGIPAAAINAEHQISTRIDDDTYEIVVASPATSSGTGGGAGVLATYEINTGSTTSTSGTGWGAGPWGGGSVRLVGTLTNPFTTTVSSGTVQVTHNAHGASDGDYVVLSGSTDTGGIGGDFLVGSFAITNSTANTYDIIAKSGQTATSSTTGGGTVIATYYSSSSTGWGEASSSTILTARPRYWTYDNYGEDIVANPRNGAIYFWDRDTATEAVELSTLAGADSGVPVVAAQVLVSNERSPMAFATNPIGSNTQDRLLIRWASSETLTTWIPDITNSAGELRIQTGSRFMTAIETRAEVLVFTDTSLSSLQFRGPPYFYGIETIAANTSIWGPSAAVSINDTTYWMGRDNFYSYRGAVETIPCTVWDKVFLNIDFDNEFNVVAGTNRQFGEVIWFYAGTGSQYPDKYVIYNFRENAWYYGQLGRTTWLDTSFGNKPRAIDENGNYFYHDSGFNDNSVTPPVALEPFILSSPLEIGDGDQFVFADKVIPDITFRNSTTVNAVANFSIITQDWPGADYSETDLETATKTSANPIEQYTNLLHVRVRGRSVILKVDSSQTGTGWRIGTPRLRIRPDGGKS